jgi:hypothetical protein
MNVTRRLIAVAGAVLLAATATACTDQSGTAASTSSSSTSPTLIATGAIPTVPNDLATNSAHHSIPVPGEQFSLTVDYWTDYPASTWQTLQPKQINLSVHLTPAASTTGDPPEVLVGSLTATTTLLAAMPGLDGLPIAVTDQEPNALPGYLINENYPYDNAVSIEGFDPTLIQRWTLLAGDQPLTEPALITAGVYGNRITFNYRILVRNTGDAGYHQRLLQDTLTTAQAPAAAGTAPASTEATPSG